MIHNNLNPRNLTICLNLVNRILGFWGFCIRLDVAKAVPLNAPTSEPITMEAEFISWSK